MSKSGLRKLELANVSQMSGIKSIQVKNPLVVTMIISDYSLSRKQFDKNKYNVTKVHGGLLKDDEDDDDEEGVRLKDIPQSGSITDHCSIATYFNVRRGYTLVHSSNGSLRIGRQVKTQDKVRDKFEHIWTSDSIERYNEEIVKELLVPENPEKYDGLIYFIAARGTSDGLIYTSDGIEFSLEYIFAQFNNENCPCLRKLPKLFFIDVERGENKNTTRKQNNNNNQEQKPQIMSTRTTGNINDNGSRESKIIETEKNKRKTRDERKIDDEQEKKKDDSLNSNFYNQSETYIKDGDMLFVYSCPPNFSGGIRPAKYKYCSLFILRVCKVFGGADIETLDLSKIINKIKDGVKKECKKLGINQIMAPQCVNRFQYQVSFKSRIAIKK